MPDGDDLLDKVASFGYQVKEFFHYLCANKFCEGNVIAHFHEWMAGTAIPGLRKDNAPVGTIFTTHATMLGRYLAMNDPRFYENLSFVDWAKEAKYFNIESTVLVERAAAHGSHGLGGGNGSR